MLRIANNLTVTLAKTLERAKNVAIRGAFSKEGWAIADQVLISAANFATMVLLARGLSPDSFGWFTLMFSILLLAGNLQDDLVSLPHNVLGASRRGLEYARYTASTALSQILLGLSEALLALLVWLVAIWLQWEVAPLILALVPLVFFWQFNEFARRALYTEQRIAAAVANDLVSNGLRVILIVVAWREGTLSPLSGLHILGVTAALGASFGWWQLRASLKHRMGFSAFRENWHYGKWLMSSDIVANWLCTKVFVYLAAGLLGVAATGTIKALDVVFGPSRLFVQALSNVLPTRLARTLEQHGHKALNKQLRLIAYAAVPLMGGYCLLIAVFAKPVLWITFGDRYQDAAPTLALFSVFAAFSYLSTFLGTALRAKRLTRQVFIDRAWASLISIPAGCLLMYFFGLTGAVLGLVATHLSMSILHWISYRRDDQRATELEKTSGQNIFPAHVNADEAVGQPAEERPALDDAVLVLRRLTGSTEANAWSFQEISADRITYLAHRKDGAPIWQDHPGLVVKLFLPTSSQMTEIAQSQFDLLTLSARRLNGRVIGGWTIRAPLPLMICDEPTAVVMSVVPGHRLRGILRTAEPATAKLVNSTAPVVVAALRPVWEDEQQVYGDLHFENILCDVDRKIISFVDPGPPTHQWYASENTQITSPACRDMATLLFDVVMTLAPRSLRTARRERDYAESVVRSFLSSSPSSEEASRRVQEIRACVGRHGMGRGGLDTWRWLKRLVASQSVAEILYRAEASSNDVGQRQQRFAAAAMPGDAALAFNAAPGEAAHRLPGGSACPGHISSVLPNMANES